MSYYVYSGEVSSGIVISDWDYLYVSAGGTANSTTVNSDGDMYVEEGGTANKTTVGNGGYMVVLSGGTAISTTVSRGGILFLYEGCTAYDVDISAGGELGGFSWSGNRHWDKIENGSAAVADNVTIVGYEMFVSSGGTVNGSALDNKCCLYVFSGGVTNNITVKHGDMVVHSGGAVNSTTVNHGDMVVHSGGTANSTTVNSSGSMTVLSGGTTNSTTVNSSGSMTVLSGGTALNVIWTPFVGRIYAENGAIVTFASNCRGGVYFGSNNQLRSSALTMTGKTLTSGDMYIMNGGTANNTVNDRGYMCVWSGGTANKTTLTRKGEIHISSGGVANSTTMSTGLAVVCEGGVANSTTVHSHSFLLVERGGVANSTTVIGDYDDHGCLDVHGTANSIIVNGGGCLYIWDGGKVTGRLTFAPGAIVSAYAGSIVDFDVSRVSAGSPALVNGLAYCLTSEGFDPDFTVTVADSQRSGKYILADGLYGFDETLTVSTRQGQELGVLTVGGSFEYEDISYALGLAGGNLTLTVANSRPGGDPDAVIPAGTPINGEIGFDGVYQAGFRMGLEHAGWYTVTGEFGRLNGSVSIVQGKKTVASGTVKKGVLSFNGGKDVLLDPANEYTIVVKNTDKGKSADEYSFTLKPTALFTKGDNSDDWTDVKAKGDASEFYGNVGTITATWAGDSDWVGYGDAVDYKAFTLDSAAKLSFSVTATDATKFTICQLVEGKDTYTVKNIQATTLSKPKNAALYSAVTKDQLLEAGTYYIKVESTNANKGGNADYSVTVNGTSVFYTAGDNSDDWTDVKTAGAAGAVGDVGKITTPGVVIADEWVGYGDAVDYKEFTLDSAAKLNFTVTASDAAKFTICRLESKYDKKKDVTTYTIKNVQATTLSKPKGSVVYSAVTKDQLLEAGTYYLKVESTNAAKGGNADYTVTVNGSSVFYTAGDNSDDNWQDFETLPELAADDTLDDWVGYGDKIDYRALTIDPDGGFYSFDLAGAENNVKLTVYAVNAKTDKKGNVTYSLKSVKSVTATAKKPNVSTGDLCLNGATQYVLAVEAPNAAKAQNSAYTVAMTEKGTFANLGNESWDTAAALDSDVDGFLTTAAGGDKFDYFDISAVAGLNFDAGQGKLKLSFYNEQKKAVKVAEMTMADGSVKKNVASLTLVADNKTTDNFTLADVGEAVKYLKIEAATNGINTYGLSLIA